MNISREIPSKETYLVHHPVLRKGKPTESCTFEIDDLKTTHHLACFLTMI